MSDTKTESQPLVAATPEAVKKEIALRSNSASAAAAASATPANDLDQQAQAFVDQLLAIDPSNPPAKESSRASVETMASESQRSAARMSQMLQEPIGQITKRGANDGDVGNALIQLKMKVEELDPAKFDLQPGWFSRALGHLPGVGDPLKRYFTKYESAQTVIKAIIGSLEKGRDQLGRDNVTLLDDQTEMWTATTKLQRAIELAQMIDRKLTEKSAVETNSEKKKFIDEELIFALRQRTIDLQQQLAVSQQGIIAMELIMRNNKELMRGVNRALNVTMSALQVGVTVALALQKQDDTLKKVNAVSDTTSDLIKGTAERLKTQGAAINKQASSTMINMDSLKSAFSDLNTALTDISTFRSQALPQMAQTVLDLDRMTGEAQKSLVQIDEAKKKRAGLTIDVK